MGIGADVSSVEVDEGLDGLESAVDVFKKRMLAWENPVEFVNNMYGSHPGDDGNEYFEQVFGGG